MEISDDFYDKLLKTLLYAHLHELQLNDSLTGEGLDTLITLKFDGYNNVKLVLDELIELHNKEKRK